MKSTVPDRSDCCVRIDWPAPGGVRAVSTTRQGGFSQPPFAGFNLGAHVGDDPGAVAANRAWLVEHWALPRPPAWLSQVHGTRVVELTGDEGAAPLQVDAAWTRVPGVVCAVMTADCLPVLLCDESGTRVAAAHAGWRGLSAGVLEATVAALGSPGRLLAWLGPAIGPSAFEVGEDVRTAFVADDQAAAAAFRNADVPGKYFADIYRLADLRLRRAGVTRIFGGGACTSREVDRFFSFRRDGVTGRMASLIWLDARTASAGV